MFMSILLNDIFSKDVFIRNLLSLKFSFDAGWMRPMSRSRYENSQSREESEPNSIRGLFPCCVTLLVEF